MECRKRDHEYLLYPFGLTALETAGPLSQLREFWKTMASKWHLNPIRQLARCFQSRKTKWIKKILVIPSALADYVIKTNHDIAWDGATILRTSYNWHQRKILEAWEINCAKDPLNRADGALLPKEYLHLTLANKKK